MKKVIFSAVIIVTLFSVFNLADSIYAGSSAYAENLTMSATINSSATISLSSAIVDLNITPSENGTLGKSSPLVVSTYTNSNYDCAVTMTTSSTQLTHSTDSTASIASLASGSTYTDSTFQNDRWGYAIGTGNYNPVATGSGANPITTVSTNTGSTAATTNIYFAAKLTPATKPGTYSNTVTFASTCTPPPLPEITDLTNMQDFASLSSDEKTAVLNSMTLGQQYQLQDNRDTKPYYIAKLADGNVWMTQNLDHDIVAQANYYTPQNTDIPANWTPSTATYTTGTTTWDTTSTGKTTPQSYDPGDLCWNGTQDSNYGTALDTGTVACGNDKHMHIGNYYSWTAALAMNDSSSYTDRNTDVDQSICPAGWRLPISGYADTGPKSFQYLWDQYSSTFGGTTMMNSPLYYVYGGDWCGYSEYVGSYGFYWSSMVGSSDFAYDLFFNVADFVDPQGNAGRHYGNSVRCVLR